MDTQQGFWVMKVSNTSFHNSQEDLKRRIVYAAMYFWNLLLPDRPPQNLTFEDAIRFFQMDPFTVSLEITDEAERQKKEREKLPVVYLLTIFEKNRNKIHACYRNRYQAENAVVEYGREHWEDILGVPAPQQTSLEDNIDFHKVALETVRHKINEIKVRG